MAVKKCFNLPTNTQHLLTFFAIIIRNNYTYSYFIYRLNMTFLTKATTLAAALLLTACAHHQNVRPSSDGNHYVDLYGETKTEVSKQAFKQAKSYCKESKSKPYVVSEKVDYIGDMSEQDYLTKRNIADAVEAAGTAMWIFGRSHVDDAGAALSIGGDIAGDALGDPYQLHLVFNCG